MAYYGQASLNRGDYYRGDYYRGDPFNPFGFIGKVAKCVFGAAKGFITSGGSIVGAPTRSSRRFTRATPD